MQRCKFQGKHPLGEKHVLQRIIAKLYVPLCNVGYHISSLCQGIHLHQSPARKPLHYQQTKAYCTKRYMYYNIHTCKTLLKHICMYTQSLLDSYYEVRTTYYILQTI